MDAGVAVALIGGAFGLLTALLTFAQPIVLKLLERRAAPAVSPPPVLSPDDPPVSDDDPVTQKLLFAALVEELHRQTARADQCEARERER